ncbi:Ankyrin repeat domain containing protein [Pandoravirus macleodensis]|uniref:Ankyrin repeat domain containing protein n=1 Tax=Pandoravirus macleodensis TaxID=2107707 RepID=A0A2U7UFE4_9VIRU|nr:Ankyrin repeat domain containing protein [Pandoravirus macleodensis]AVK77164.1 Ankyrin repeat domain containing protein [Pandoravirus macleodensis]UMO79875.1 Ankyrin repeat domain containing protein [Pandoravirus aubagnensis]
MTTGPIAHRAALAIVDLPPEAVCEIIRRLSNRDLLSARRAHRCFGVVESETTRTRRKHDMWLRTSPERACQAGRIDMLAYLYRRNRIPHTISLCESAVRSGSMDMMLLVRERDTHWHTSKAWGDTGAIRLALRNGHMDIAWYLIKHGTNVDIGSVTCTAASLPCVDVIDWLRETRPRGWDAHRALCIAAQHDKLDVVARLVSDDNPRLQEAIDTACVYGSVHAVEFLIDHAPWLCPKRALERAAGSCATVQSLMRRYPDLDARHILDIPWVPVDVVRTLHDAYPQHSLQCLLDNARTSDVARFACGSGQRLDLQQALDNASIDQRFSIVLFLYSVDDTLDLTRAINVASRMKSPYAMKMLYAVCPSIDLQHALNNTYHPEFAAGLLEAYPQLCVGRLIERFGSNGDWTFLCNLTASGHPRE